MAKFKTRARAIDLLGRQQIAGIPTAINELFKNAHDAYADHVDVDFLRTKKLFVLRDDGLGMTKEDFESRWLVLGTESKFDNVRMLPPPIDKSKKKRPVMGEKGIGRLAISAIGKQVLVLSRAKRDSDLSDKLVAAFINWGIFEIPGLDIDDVVIPVREFCVDDFPGQAEIDLMKNEIIDSVHKLVEENKIYDIEALSIIDEINDFVIDPQVLISKLPMSLDLKVGSGTHFYISPTADSLTRDIDGEKSDIGTATKLEKFLIGFTDTMTPEHPLPNIEASFRDYKSDDFGSYVELIDKTSFFTPEEFMLADHHVVGDFDEYGQFAGEVTVYNQHTFNHKINWSDNNFKKTTCGAFSIAFSYLQGMLNQSYVDPISHSRLKGKLDKFGGLYIYKDGIRILPYGDSDYDFLEIEQKRTKSASYYYFSYRRMFGVINISRDNNRNLVEKAGREGFIENKAYKEIREILKNFFYQLANDFFREKGSGTYVEYWKTLREERSKHYKAQEAREKRAKAKKDKFQESLKSFFDKMREGYYKQFAAQLISDTKDKVKSAIVSDDTDEIIQSLMDIESEQRKALSQWKSDEKITAPRGFNISKDIRGDWEAFLEEYGKIEVNVFDPTEKEIIAIIEEIRKSLQLNISRRKRLERAVDEISDEAKLLTRSKKNEINQISTDINNRIKILTQELMENLEQRIRTVKTDFAHLEIVDKDDVDIYEAMKQLESPIVQEKEKALKTLDAIISQLESIYWEKSEIEGIVTNSEIMDSLQEEIGELKDKQFQDIELIQLGLAINIVHHEFGSAVTSLRSSIRDLKRWADVNEQLDSTYKNIRTNFEHLDGYLTMLTPMNRRLYRTKESIEAIDIFAFLEDVFRGRLQRHNVTLKRTKFFTQSKLDTYRSIIYPVFVNVVDNAIHWLKQQGDDVERIIRLHADRDGNYYISNNGVPMSPGDRDRIFEYGFSRKPNGRGMGLAISKDVLNSNGFDIVVDEPRKDMEVTFKITPLHKD